MKKFLLFLGALAISCCLSGRAQARIALVQEYNFDILETLMPSKEKTTINSCPNEFPIPESEKPEEKNGVKCKTNGYLYNGTKCYSCEGPCDDVNSYPYSEADCEGLSPSQADDNVCVSAGTGKKRYKNCCSNEYYEAKELIGDGKNSNFSFSDPMQNTKKTITCYKPLGCAGGRSKIDKTNSSDFTIKASGSTYEASYRKSSCTKLTLLSVFKNSKKANNFYCATGYSCGSLCYQGQPSLSSSTCVLSPTKDTNLSGYWETNCYYYSGCNTVNDSNCFNYASVSNSMNVTVSSDFKDIASNNPNKKCMRFDGCKSGVVNDKMYGSDYSVDGEGILKSESTLGEGTKRKYCYTYTCAEGWTVSSGTGSTTVSALSSNGTYDVSLVQGGGKWFACKKAKPQNKVCFKNCSQGKWYDITAQDCLDGTTSAYVYHSKVDKKATLFSLSELSYKKWDELTASQLSASGVNVSSLWNNVRANDIRIVLIGRYGENHCFLTSKNGAPCIIRATNSGFVEVTSASDFEQCQ